MALVIMAWLLPGVQVEGVGTAIVAVGVIALLNALLWPLLSYVLLPFAVLTLGLLSLLMNGAFILLASALVDGCEVKNLGSAILLALGLTAITTILSSLLTIDDDSVWFRNVLRRRARRRSKVAETDEPGFVFLEFDGLTRPILERARRKGIMPNLARWLETGEGAAFEEQIGLHGGMAGSQIQPFLLVPSELPLTDEPLIGAEAVYRLLKGWVSPTGQEEVSP